MSERGDHLIFQILKTLIPALRNTLRQANGIEKLASHHIDLIDDYVLKHIELACLN